MNIKISFVNGHMIQNSIKESTRQNADLIVMGTNRAIDISEILLN